MSLKDREELNNLTLEIEQLTSLQSAVADAMQCSGNDPCQYIGGVILLANLMNKHYQKVTAFTNTAI